MNQFSKITKKGSRTFYYASLLFPKDIRKEVHIVYAYVRTIDDLIDQAKPDLKTFKKLKNETYRSLTTDNRSTDNLVSAFVDTFNRYHMKKSWLDSFFSSQELDLTKTSYKTFEELLEFIHGVAEVIGLFMSSLMQLPEKSHTNAMYLGRSMQLLNIIRDIPEDYSIGRTYIPQEDMKQFGVTNLNPQKESHEKLKKLILFEIERFQKIHNEAGKGLKYIPKKYRAPITTSYNLYTSTSQKIYNEPLSVFEKKVRPSVPRIILEATKTYLY